MMGARDQDFGYVRVHGFSMDYKFALTLQTVSHKIDHILPRIHP
jgi:hypothetical protein